MHKINKLFDEVKNELWNIKRYNSPIDLKELADFYKEYKSCSNLVVDTINAQVVQYDGFNMPFSEEDISYMIDVFITFNQYNYDRLIAKTLFVLKCPQAYQYLNKILSNEENRNAFIKDFQRFSHFEQVKKELLKLGNTI